MTNILTINRNSDKSRSGLIASWLPYLAIGIVTNVVIWSLAIAYLKRTSPSYTSDFAISLPATGSSANVNVPGVGQASASSESPYQINSQDPRENYKFLLTSKSVLKAAAKKLNMRPGEFGQPRVTIISNTTLMKVELAGDSPEIAQNKAKALFEALQEKLDQLREQQIEQQDRVLQGSLAASESKLKEAQKRLSDYKVATALNSTGQITNLTTNIEQLRKQKAEVVAQQQQATGRALELSSNLKISSEQASEGFVLQTDPIFQRAFQDYSESNAAYNNLMTRFLPTHPAVVEEKAKRDGAERLLLSRASILLGRPVNQQIIAQLNQNNTGSNGSAKTTLSQQLVTAEAEKEGLTAQAKALDQQIRLLEERLKNLGKKESTLENLERDVRTAEAVFTSTLTRLDLGKSTVSGSYPQTQVFSEPSLSRSATSPKPLFVFAGAALGSLFCSNGILLLWYYQRRKRLRQDKKANSLEETMLQSDSLPEMLELTQNSQESDKAHLNGKQERDEAKVER
ncbi:GumC family protein [Aerosakkonemataceae cyanobacterium BLCC-F154]|uniref:GumC family protein n=1 Tax=Floridaenema fluviatile BLCC-F154 TaxID=3153640 RepID=A0ABV4YHH6_9CYAN